MLGSEVCFYAFDNLSGVWETREQIKRMDDIFHYIYSKYTLLFTVRTCSQCLLRL